LHIKLNINNERQDCKNRYGLCVQRVLVGRGRVNDGHEGEGIWLMDFNFPTKDTDWKNGLKNKTQLFVAYKRLTFLTKRGLKCKDGKGFQANGA
jgi:hypothetical protein